jgi:hypothetical protein
MSQKWIFEQVFFLLTSDCWWRFVHWWIWQGPRWRVNHLFQWVHLLPQRQSRTRRWFHWLRLWRWGITALLLAAENRTRQDHAARPRSSSASWRRQWKWPRRSRIPFRRQRGFVIFHSKLNLGPGVGLTLGMAMVLVVAWCTEEILVALLTADDRRRGATKITFHDRKTLHFGRFGGQWWRGIAVLKIVDDLVVGVMIGAFRWDGWLWRSFVELVVLEKVRLWLKIRKCYFSLVFLTTYQPWSRRLEFRLGFCACH